MPIYEFRCRNCNHRFEKLCAMGETGEHLVCPECGSTGPQRVMSGFVSRSTGEPAGTSGGSSGCASCSATSCSSCSH